MLYIIYILLALFTAIYSVYILWQVFSWINYPIFNPVQRNYKTRVSIIIACRNEERNIGECIEAILKQNYPASLVEIIIADDHSEDNTRQVAENAFKETNIAWKFIPAGENQFNKKNAITSAIAQASGELIVVTDADCVAGPIWLSSIISLYEEKNYQMICGPVATSERTQFL